MNYKDKVIGFLQPLCNYVREDLEKFHEIMPDERGKKGCGVGEVLTCFAIIDIFGFLYNTSNDYKKNTNNDNLVCALTQKDLFLDILPDASYAEIVIHLFRHAASHHYLPRQIGLIKPTPNGSGRSLFCKVLKTKTGSGIEWHVNLNVNFLNWKTRQCIDTILKNLMNESPDSTFFNNKCERIEFLQEKARNIFNRTDFKIDYAKIEADAENLTSLYINPPGPILGTQHIDYPYVP